jgi:hypothetical protein
LIFQIFSLTVYYFFIKTDTPEINRMEDNVAEGSFPRFSELPFELRDMIWKLAIPKESIIHAKERDRTKPGRKLRVSIWESETTERAKVTERPQGLGIEAVSSPPPLLFAFKESNTVALKHYEKIGLGYQGTAQSWINYQSDVLYISKFFSFERLDEACSFITAN